MNLTATVTFDPGQSTSKIIHIPIDRDQNDRAICSITFNHPARRALRGGHAEQCHGGGDRPGVRAGAVAGGRAGDGGHRPCAAVPGDAVPGGVRDGDGGLRRHRGRHGDRYTATSGLRGARHAAAGGRHRRLRADRRRRRPAATHALGGGRRPAAGHRGRRDPLAAAGIDPGFTLALEGTRSETGVTASADHSLTLRASLGWQVSLQRSNRNIQGNDSAAPARRAAEERVVARAAAQYVVARSARCGMVRRHRAATRGCRGRRSAPRRPPSCAGRTWPRTWTSRIWMPRISYSTICRSTTGATVCEARGASSPWPSESCCCRRQPPKCLKIRHLCRRTMQLLEALHLHAASEQRFRRGDCRPARSATATPIRQSPGAGGQEFSWRANSSSMIAARLSNGTAPDRKRPFTNSAGVPDTPTAVPARRSLRTVS